MRRYWILVSLFLLGCDNDKPKATTAPSASAKSDKKTPPPFGLLADPLAEPSGSPKPSASAASAASAPKSALAEGAVKLLSQGAEPRKELRYAFKAGSVETFTFEVRTTVSVDAGATKLKDQKVPGVRCELTATTKEVSPEGAALLEWSLEKVDVLAEAGTAPDQAKEEREAWNLLKGKLGKSAITSRGLTIVADFQSQDPNVQAMLDRLRMTLGEVSLPLPEEAVGKGAKWLHRRKPLARDLEPIQEETFELTELTAVGGKVQRVYVETAEPREMQGRVPGSKVSLDVYKGSGTVTSTFDLLKAVPKSESSLLLEQTITQSTPDGKKETIKQSLKTISKLLPAAPKK